MRCEICDSTYRVGADFLCKKCRTAIKGAKWKNVEDDPDDEFLLMAEESEHRSMNRIDTSVADYYSRQSARENEE